MCDLGSKMMDFFACKKREKTGVYDFPSTGKRSPYAKYVPISAPPTI